MATLGKWPQMRQAQTSGDLTLGSRLCGGADSGMSGGIVFFCINAFEKVFLIQSIRSCLTPLSIDQHQRAEFSSEMDPPIRKAKIGTIFRNMGVTIRQVA